MNRSVETNEAFSFGLTVGLVVGIIAGATISIVATLGDSERLRLVQQELDGTVRELESEQRRATELARDTKLGLESLARNLSDGASTLSTRIRLAAKVVQDMENRLLDYERSGGGSGSRSID